MKSLLRRDLPLLTLLLLGAALGCTAEAPHSPPGETSLSWRRQIEAVRRGETTQIVMDRPIEDRDLAELDGLEQLETLKLHQGVVTDAGLKPLAKLPHLRQLVLRASPITDDGAEILATFPALQIVNLPQSEIGDAGLQRLAALKKLELLRLGSSKPLSARALKSFVNAPQLRFLHFIGIPLTDDALKPLGEIAGLESLYIDGGALSDEALSELLRRRPKLHLHLDQKHIDSDPRRRDHPH